MTAETVRTSSEATATEATFFPVCNLGGGNRRELLFTAKIITKYGVRHLVDISQTWS